MEKELIKEIERLRIEIESFKTEIEILKREKEYLIYKNSDLNSQIIIERSMGLYHN